MNTAHLPQLNGDHTLHAAQFFFLDGYEIRVVPCGEAGLWLYRGTGDATSFRDLGVVRWSVVHAATLTVSVAFSDWAPPGSPRAQHLLAAALRIYDTNNQSVGDTSQWIDAYETSPRSQPDSALVAAPTEEIPMAATSPSIGYTAEVSS